MVRSDSQEESKNQFMKTQTEIYIKHYSFRDFYSNLNTDIPVQQQRVLTLLKTLSTHGEQALISSIVENLRLAPEVAPDFKITPHIADELSKIEDEDVVRYMIHRYRYDVYPKQKVLDDYPPYLQIEPTSVCNYRCVFCYQIDPVFTNKQSGHMGSMTFDLFKEIIDQIEGKIEFLSLASRGEPLLCKDIDRMIQYCVGKFLGLKLNTNASMLNERHCHAILAGGVNTIVFSADAAKEPLYSQLRVKGSLEKVINNIRLFQEIKRKHYPHSKIITRVSGVKYGENQDMDSMIALWGELVDQVSFVTYNPWENVYDAPTNAITAACSDLWRRMFIWFNGQVNPCDTDYKSSLSVGSVAKDFIPKLWRCESYERLRQTHLTEKRSCLNPCQRCVVV